ncbi:MAG: DoxX family protein [Armatimonadota bacterium]|nr:DoxX family protein [Armatimonadota bacterium]
MQKRTSTDLALLILRLTLGGIMVAHGLQTLGAVPGGAGSLQGTIDSMAAKGIPSWLAYLSVLAELGGGVALVIGFLGKLAAFGVAVNMAVAIYKVHLNQGFFNPGVEFPLALFAMAAALLVTGMGGYSADAAIASSMDKTISGKKDASAPPPS